MKNKKSCRELARVAELYDLDELDKNGAARSLKRMCKENARKIVGNFTSCHNLKQLLFKRVPCLEWIINYRFKSYIMPDILSGFTVGIMNVPQGMAYAMLATLRPVNGLYISFFPLLVYALFGTSKHIAIGSSLILFLF